jgi:hypothetical protein
MARQDEDRGHGQQHGGGPLERLRAGVARLMGRGRREGDSGRREHPAHPAPPAGTGTTGTGLTMSGHQRGAPVPQQDEPDDAARH